MKAKAPKPKLSHVDARGRVRMVDVTSESYRIARAYMVRLEAEDLAEADSLEKYAALTGLTPQGFRERFAHTAPRP